jgi:hypothetical protein
VSARPPRLGVALLALLVSCQPGDGALLPDARVHALMQCQECNAGEHAAVVVRGDTVVPLLRDLLLNGPPANFITQVRARLEEPVDTGGGVLVPPPPAAVETLLEDYRTIYRVRSSRALGAIGGDPARQALCAGKAQNFPRHEVREAIDSALAALSGTCP